MGNLNKVMLIGRLGADPELRHTKNGDSVANFRLATSETWRDKSGNKQERTEWHSIVAWRHLADLAQNYLKKGRQVYIEGKLQTRDWTDAQNVRHYRTEVVASRVEFLERMDSAGGSTGPRASSGGQDPYHNQAPPPESYDEQPPSGGYVEDDIPF